MSCNLYWYVFKSFNWLFTGTLMEKYEINYKVTKDFCTVLYIQNNYIYNNYRIIVFFFFYQHNTTVLLLATRMFNICLYQKSES